MKEERKLSLATVPEKFRGAIIETHISILFRKIAKN